jgi:hypothetical protein
MCPCGRWRSEVRLRVTARAARRGQQQEEIHWGRPIARPPRRGLDVETKRRAEMSEQCWIIWHGLMHELQEAYLGKARCSLDAQRRVLASNCNPLHLIVRNLSPVFKRHERTFMTRCLWSRQLIHESSQRRSMRRISGRVFIANVISFRKRRRVSAAGVHCRVAY